MAGAVLSFPYMGILAILLMTMTLEADALTAWDCSRDGLESRTVFLKDLSEGEKALVEGMRTSGVQYPDELAYKIKREPGYTAIMEEDKIHIVQCKPVVALVLPQDKCYDRLQVVYHDNIYFLTPWTHIITETANEISCDAPNLRDYELEGSTYKIVPRPGVSLKPRRDKNFLEEPVNSSPKYKVTEYLRRRKIGRIDTVSKEPIESSMYRLEHPELDLEPRRDKNFEEDPVNSSPKLTPKYKETAEYRRRRNIGGIDTVSKEFIELYIYRLEHPELDDQDIADEQPKRRPVLTVADEPEKRPVLTVADEPERRPVLTVADEPERRPVLTVAHEPERRPVLTMADEHEIPWYKNMDISFFIYVFIGALLIPSILVIFSVMLVGCIKYGSALYFFRRENRGHLHTNQPLHISPDLNLKQNKKTVKIAYNRI